MNHESDGMIKRFSSENQKSLEKDLKHLRRAELLEIIIDQMKETQTLQRQLEEARNMLAQREIMLEEVGSIAEAALRMNHIFEDAQKAADLYLENVRRIGGQQVKADAR